MIFIFLRDLADIKRKLIQSKWVWVVFHKISQASINLPSDFQAKGYVGRIKMYSRQSKHLSKQCTEKWKEPHKSWLSWRLTGPDWSRRMCTVSLWVLHSHRLPLSRVVQYTTCTTVRDSPALRRWFQKVWGLTKSYYSISLVSRILLPSGNPDSALVGLFVDSPSFAAT